MKAGTRLGCVECSTEVILVRPAEDEVTLTCSDAALVDVAAPREDHGHPAAEGEGTLLGKRYVDEEAGIELLCTKAGPGSLACDGRPLAIKGAKPLPSSD
ncbi:MAG TPA: hypothetical protein VK277_16885 [Acidimicrobiales bacterium]|nr:hypothetical protein [Acidimicrobiales bacterium]